MKTKYGIAIVAMAVFCILAAPAFALDSPKGDGQAPGGNAPNAGHQPNVQAPNSQGPNGQGPNDQGPNGQGPDGKAPNAGSHEGGFGLGESDDWMLLVDDATKENFENMTLAQIEDLREQKTSELNNMTLAEIKELREQKATEAREKFENMTLGEIKEMRNETRLGGADVAGQRGNGAGKGAFGFDEMGQGGHAPNGLGGDAAGGQCQNQGAPVDNKQCNGPGNKAGGK